MYKPFLWLTVTNLSADSLSHGYSKSNYYWNAHLNGSQTNEFNCYKNCVKTTMKPWQFLRHSTETT